MILCVKRILAELLSQVQPRGQNTRKACNVCPRGFLSDDGESELSLMYLIPCEDIIMFF
jgi:hypothetical protein